MDADPLEFRVANPPYDSLHRAARVAGLTLALGLILVLMGNYVVGAGLIVPGNAADTARNILAHERRFRLFVAFDLLYVMDLLILLSTLYVVLRPVDRGLALAATACRMVYAFAWVLTTLAMMGALRFLGDAPYLKSFELGQLQAVARMLLRAGYDAYYLGLPFFALASALCSWLWVRSGFVPKGLAVAGLVVSVWGLACALAFLVNPAFEHVVDANLFDMPLVLFELVLGLWLAAKGIRAPEAQSLQR
jgi:hypothetical protein